MPHLNKQEEKKCVCGEKTTFGDTDVEIGGVCHRTKNPCYIIPTEQEKIQEQMDRQFNDDTNREWRERFDEKFVDKIKNIYGGFAYEEMKYGEQQDVQELRDFIQQELTRERAKTIAEVKQKIIEGLRDKLEDGSIIIK